MKDVLLRDLGEEFFPWDIKNILVIARRGDEVDERRGFLDLLKRRFPKASLNVIIIGKVKNFCKGKERVDLVTFIKPHDLRGSTQYDIERVALKINPKYTMIYEERYGTVRLANQLQMIYRLYFRDEAILLFKLALKVLIIFPAYLFYYGYRFFSSRRVLWQRRHFQMRE